MTGPSRGWGKGDCPSCRRRVGVVQRGNPPRDWVTVSHGPVGARCPGSGREVALETVTPKV